MIKTLFYIAIIYFAVKFFSRFILPLIINKAADKAHEKLKKQAEEMKQQNDKREEGEISIRQKPASKKRNNDDGEYVDFEEIK